MPPVGRAALRKQARATRRQIVAALAAGYDPDVIAEQFNTTEQAILLIQEEMERKETA